jgi:ABC-type glycerol-3-phosphate transport system substrate-binding protein
VGAYLLVFALFLQTVLPSSAEAEGDGAGDELIRIETEISDFRAAASAAGRGSLSREEIDDILWRYTIDASIPGFREYRDTRPNNRPGGEIVINAADFARYYEGNTAAVPQTFTDFEGEAGVSVLTSENSTIEFEFNVPEAGFYDISLLYYPIGEEHGGKSSEMQRSFFVNGALPYREIALVQFARIWQNSTGGIPGTMGAREATIAGHTNYVDLQWGIDNQKNELKPRMLESPEWLRTYLRDVDGYIPTRLSVYFDAGVNTITIAALREPMLLRAIYLDNPPPIVTYSQYRNYHDGRGARSASAGTIELQGQNAIRTSSQMLYPVQDTSSPALTPASPRLLLNNTIGGHSWRLPGQWVEWNFTVPESGYYTIGLNVRQNFRRGTQTFRRISINGEVPFAEMDGYGFSYSQTWRHETLTDSDGDAYLFYLEAGQDNTIRLEVVLGGFAEIVSEVQEIISDLSAIYRQAIRLIGVNPDRLRDYQIGKNLPNLVNEMIVSRDRLNVVIDELRSIDARGGGDERMLVSMRDLLNRLIDDVERFPRVTDTFKAAVRACGTWLNESLLQPLQIDSIHVASPQTRVRLGNNSIFHRIWFELSRLFWSFFIDYSAIGSVGGAGNETITLWIGSGRDQANVVKGLIDERFSNDPENPRDINVNVMLMDMNTLLQATLAGQGPDVAIQVPGELPMNFGLRNAVADLTQFTNLPAIRERFHPEAMIPFEFEGTFNGEFRRVTYALPETQTFPMLFYRKDILSELEIEIPQTWDEVKVVMAILAQNNMEFGMMPSEMLFATILFQNGGEYYNEDASRSALDNEQGFNAFRKYTEFYTDFKLEREISVQERFRTGETPLIIDDYTAYNIFQVSAPDLRGMWGFAPIPGTLQEDGTINRIAATTVTACIMMYMSNREASWEFLQWWTSAETQTLFAREMESLMGSAARIPTANLEAFANLPWPAADRVALEAQREYIRGIPQVPGGYFSFRNINNAFYRVTTELHDRPAGQRQEISPREELTDKVILINDEIRHKRMEFGLPLYGE